MEKLTPAQLELIKKPLPLEAVKPHPTKTYLSSIKAIYVTERLNEVFWVWVWQIRVRKEETWKSGMIVVHTIFEVPTYWIYYECFGGNDNGWETSKNFDLWDAYKWATTDAITKIASWIWIWIDVFKWKWNQQKEPDITPRQTPQNATGWVSIEWFNKPQLQECIKADNAYSMEAIEAWAKDNWYRMSWPSRVMSQKYLDNWEL